MTFLNPFVLLGLAAAAIPILLHLLNLRKLKTIEFSTLSFLKELQKTKIRRMKIRQWLLLFLRTLLVILLVMAFARPTLKGSFIGGLGERAKTTSVFILDDSESMTALDEHGELLQQAKEAALQAAGVLKDGDEVYLLKLSDIGTAATEEMKPIRNFDVVRSELRDLKPSFRHATIDDALRVSAKLLAGSTNFNKEVYLFSDFQKGAFASQLSPTQATEDLFAETVHFYLTDLGIRPPKNVGITSVNIPNSLFEAGKAFSLQVRVTNAGENNVQDHILSLFLNGDRVAQKSVDVQSRSFADVEFNAVPKSAGLLEGTVELESDDLEFDNRRYFSLEIPEHIRILLVGSPADLQYIKLALSAHDSSSRTVLRVRDVTPEKLNASDISAADILIVSNPRDLSDAQASRLELFLDAGGGLILFPGAQTEPASFNSGFAAKLKIPHLAGIERLQKGTSETESFLTFDRVELRHPLFQGMFEETATSLTQHRPSNQIRSVESPQVRSFARFQLPPNAREIISLSNGAPFLAELQTNNRHLLLFAVAANTEWSDFPMKGLFVPLLYRSVSYLAQGPLKQRDILVGGEYLLRSRSGSAGNWTVASPNKVETVVRPTSAGTERIVHFRETDMPGIYAIKNSSSVVQKFAVNMNPDETNTAKVEPRDLQSMFARLGIPEQSLHRISAASEIQQVILHARFGVELWKHFLIAALAVALVEMIVARESKQELVSFQPSAP